MLQVNAQFLVKTSLKIVYLKKKKIEREYTFHQIQGHVFRQWARKKTGSSSEWSASLIPPLWKRGGKKRQQGMKKLNSSYWDFNYVVDTTIKDSLCSWHTLGWLRSSQWFSKWPFCHLGELCIPSMYWWEVPFYYRLILTFPKDMHKTQEELIKLYPFGHCDWPKEWMYGLVYSEWYPSMRFLKLG